MFEKTVARYCLLRQWHATRFTHQTASGTRFYSPRRAGEVGIIRLRHPGNSPNCNCRVCLHIHMPQTQHRGPFACAWCQTGLLVQVTTLLTENRDFTGTNIGEYGARKYVVNPHFVRALYVIPAGKKLCPTSYHDGSDVQDEAEISFLDLEVSSTVVTNPNERRVLDLVRRGE